MDIHRCRFVPYQPQSINALAFSHSLASPKHATPTDLRLALGRDNGDIEIWNPVAGLWVEEKTLRGSKGRTIEQLAWTQDLVVDDNEEQNIVSDGALRLFSSGGSSALTEWNLSSGVPKRSAESNSADIWCFAAQPQWRRDVKGLEQSKLAGAPSQLLVAGCADGSTVLFSTAEDDLQFLRVLTPAPAKKSKVISITWRDRTTVIAGYENSLIRVIDITNRSVLRTMSLGKSHDGSASVVWTVKVLPDGTILSGDSSGELKIWDAKNYSLIQKLKTHEADILAVASSTAGDLIYTAGVDRRTVTYQQVQSQAGQKRNRWQEVVHRRYHQHDVKALAAFESKDIKVLVSGGVDTVPVVLPLRNFDTEYHRGLSHLPHTPQMSSSTKARFLLSWWQQELSIWHLPKQNLQSGSQESMQTGAFSHKLLAKLKLDDDENITSARISENGSMIVAATSSKVRLFQIRQTIRDGMIQLRTRTINLPKALYAFGATSVGFSPDSKWLYAVRGSNLVVMIKVIPAVSSKDKISIIERVVKLDRSVSKKPFGHLGAYKQSIHCVAFSSDSRILATGDLSGHVDAWILEGHEDAQNNTSGGTRSGSPDSSSDSESDSDDESDSSIIDGQKWIRNPASSRLPQLDSAILALSFKPITQSASTKQEQTVGLHPTRHNPHPISHEFPAADTKLVAITASHSIIEFDVLAAKLSDWSRRNPSTCLPSHFTQIKDRVMGAFWDCSPGPGKADKKRLWMFGAGFLFMLDMSRDIETEVKAKSVGKLGNYDVKDGSEHAAAGLTTSAHVSRKRKRNTGAGDVIKSGQWQRAPNNTSSNKEHVVDSGLMSPISDEDEDEDVEMEDADNLAQMRRGIVNDREPQSKADSSEQLSSADTAVGPPYHSIFRYKSIFGVAVLSPSPDSTSISTSSQEEFDDHDPGLEIAIVERPIYDVELLPRFDGGQDWTT